MIRLETYLILLQERDVELQDSSRTRATQEKATSFNHLLSQATVRKRTVYTMYRQEAMTLRQEDLLGKIELGDYFKNLILSIIIAIVMKIL